MTSNYWSQWDKDDLDSWLVKDVNECEDDLDEDIFEPEVSKVEEKECFCGYYCFDCLGISWRDFM
jgi:hypothetical protein